MLVLDREIYRVVSRSRNVGIAHTMCASDAVEACVIKYNEEDDTYIIKGKVGTHFSNSPRVVIDANNTIVDFQCDCHFCEPGNACAHVGALLFKVQEISPDTFPYSYVSKRYQELEQRRKEIAAYHQQRELELRKVYIKEKKEESKKFLEKAIDSVDHLFEPTIHSKQNIHCQLESYGTSLGMRFKIGTNHPYVIKSIPLFLERFQTKEKYVYGKNLTFVHDEQNLFETEINMLSFMKDSQIIMDYRYIDDKYILINEKNFDDMFERFYNLPKKYFDFSMKKKQFKPIITIVKEEDAYVISSDVLEFLYGKKCAYQYQNKVLYQMEFDNNGKVVELLKEMNNDDIIVDKQDINTFYRFILEELEPYIDIEGRDLLTEVSHEIERKLYGDSDDQGRIYFTMECTMPDGQVVTSFQADNTMLSPLAQRAIVYMQSYRGIVNDEDTALYFDPSDDETYRFIHEGLPVLSQYFDVYISEVLQKIGHKNTVSMKVGVRITNDLLEVNLDSVDIAKEEIVAVLESYKSKRKFHKLKNGELIFLHSDELESVTKMIESYELTLDDLQADGSFKMPKYRAFALENDASFYSDIEFEPSEEYLQLLDNISKNHSTTPLASEFTTILRDYQKEGVEWLQTLQNYQFGGILADDMGLGKTLQVIAMLHTQKQGTSIVIAPASLLLNWQDEITKFAPTMKCKVVHGSKQQRQEIINEYKKYDVIVTSYDYIRRDIDMYSELDFYYIVLDEAQYIKNQKTKSAIAVKKVNAKHRLALTGTPIENSLAELWSIFDFLMKGYLYSYSYFQKNFEYPIVREKDVEAQEKLKKLITPFVLRRTKKEVLKELPDKIEKTITVPFNEEEKKVYFANLLQVSKELQQQMEVDKVNKIEILSMLTRLRQICCEPRILYDEFKTPSSKLQACLDIIQTHKENNKKVLLFSSFTSVLALVEEELKKQDIKYFILTGAVSKEKRRELVHKFQNDDTTVFLISLKAGGTGLNLTAAEAVIHYDPWWNMSVQSQATDRAHRIGQKNVVQVFKMIMEDSIEQKIAQLQEEKRNLADAFVEGNSGTITSMNTDDLISLFSNEI